MDIIKRNGSREPLKLEKISSRIKKLTYGLNERVDPDIVSTKVVSGLYDGVWCGAASLGAAANDW